MPPSGNAAPRVIDARGLKCPWPVLRAERAMREGQAFILLADDPVARDDVPAMARRHGWGALCDREAGAAVRISLHPPSSSFAV